MHNINLNYHGLNIFIEASEESHLHWLIEFFTPNFQLVNTAKYHHKIILLTDGAYYQAIKNSGCAGNQIELFAQDQRVISFPQWHWQTALTTVYSEEHEIFCAVNKDRKEITLVSAEPNLFARLFLMRVVRELAMNYTLHNKGLFLHAAALAIDEKGIVIAGETNAGKTTMLINLLQEQDTKYIANAKYISNDRVLILDKISPPLLYSMSTIISIRQGIMDHSPLFGEKLSTSNYRAKLTFAESTTIELPRFINDKKYGVNAAQFCRLLGVEQIEHSIAHSMIFPVITKEIDTFKLIELSLEEVILRLPKILLGADKWKKSRDLFSAPDATPFPEEKDLIALAINFIKQIKCFECQIGENIYQRSETRRLLIEQLIP